MFSLLTLSISSFLKNIFFCEKRVVSILRFFSGIRRKTTSILPADLSPPDGRGPCWGCCAPSVETSWCVCPVLGLSPEVHECSRSKPSAKSALVDCPLRVPEVTFLTSQNSLRPPKNCAFSFLEAFFFFPTECDIV